jgi:hypothetical protein
LTHESVAEFWRRRFRRQKHVNAGVRSLLRKYGSAKDVHSVSSDLLLTLMGNLITSEAGFYRTSADGRTLRAITVFGSTPLDTLPSLYSNSVFVKTVMESTTPRLLNALPRAATDGEELAVIVDRYRLVAPLHFEEQLVGVVLLGRKVSDGAYSDNDIELVEALCSVTAAILSYLKVPEVSTMTGGRAGRLIARCQELAGGLADHMENSLQDIQSTIDSVDAERIDAPSVTAQLSAHVDRMRYLVSALRVLQRDPVSLEAKGVENYDPVEAIQEALFTFDPDAVNRGYSVSLRQTVGTGECRVAIPRGILVDGITTTLRRAVESTPNTQRLIVRIEQASGLPSEIGSTSEQGSGPMLQVGIRIVSGDANPAESKNSMKMHADNLQAYQTLRDPEPCQQVIVDGGGAIVVRHAPDGDAWLVYLPL